MDQMCTRCVRQAIRRESGFLSLYKPQKSLRSFSSYGMDQAEGSSEASKTSNDLRRPTGRPLIQRVPTGSSAHRTPNNGPVLQRTRQPVRTGVAQNRDRSPSSTSSPPGQLLQRSGGPRTPGSSGTGRPSGPFRAGGARTPGGPRGPGGAASRNRRPGGGVRRGTSTRLEEEEEEDDTTIEQKINDYVNTVVDPPANPTESLPYKPAKSIPVEELKMDWPPTPLSSTGLSATAIQRAETLAHRIPHGYITHEHLAEHYLRSNFTKFQSKAEMEAVVTIAQRIAKERAAKLTERAVQRAENAAGNSSGQMYNASTYAEEDMTFVPVTASTKTTSSLTSQIVAGKYPEVQRQGAAWLTNAAKNLSNNGTYGEAKTERFLAKVRSLIPTKMLEQMNKQAQTQQKA